MYSVLSDSFATPWTVARQASLSMGFPRQEYWSGLPVPPPGGLPDPRIEPGSPAVQVNSLCWATREANLQSRKIRDTDAENKCMDMGQRWGEELGDWNWRTYTINTRLPWRLRGKNSPAVQEMQVRSLGQEDRLPRKFHGQRNLVGYSPWGHKRLRHDGVHWPGHYWYYMLNR